jgi:hypothetical protein
LLCRFVEADALAERAAKYGNIPCLMAQGESVDSHSGKMRSHTDGAIRLRLSPQSRIDAKATGRYEPRLTVNPWEWNADDAQR